ncbi:MAG: aminoacyl-tRNA hydrolase [Desulfobacterales bacterium]|nr:aminoacyl-tRNA hydrolase [Desulfobacterales bacterium]
MAVGLLTALRRRFAGEKTQPQVLVAGLGNPGGDYRLTRHNAGFMVVDRLCSIHRISLDHKRFGCLFGMGDVAGKQAAFTQPQAYMNRSGPPVLRLMSYYGISSRNLLIIHDDIDIPFGRIKIKEKGGHGGHNGVRSLMEALGTGEFPRVRVGVGRPEYGGDVIRHVLEPFGAGEAEKLDGILDRAAEAAVTVLSHGAKFGMNRFNRKP